MRLDFTPEPHDFQFTHEDENYCIGYINNEFEELTCSKYISGNWIWYCCSQVFPKDDTFDAVKNMSLFLDKLNVKLEAEEGINPIPPEFINGYRELCELIYNGIEYLNGSVVIKG